MTTLITGATGFIGSAVIRKLLKAGHTVRALVRPKSDCRNLDGLDVETVNGDLNDPASLEQVVKGCRYLFHVAADYRLWVPTPKQIYTTNVEGTRNIMQAAAQAGVERIVYTSSVAAMGLNGAGKPGDENTPVRLEDMIGHYHRSKFLAEQAVLELVAEDHLPVVIVNPATPVGPRDIKPTPTGRMISDAAAGRIPAYVDTGLNFVGVDDVAEGHLLALECGRIGERYILGAENLTLQKILEQIAAIVGRKPPKIRLAHGVVLPIAYVMENVARLTGMGEPLITVEGVQLAKRKMFFSSDKAQHELGYRPGPVKDALEEAIHWFRRHG